MNRHGHDNQTNSTMHHLLSCSPVMAHLEAADALYAFAEGHQLRRRPRRPDRRRPLKRALAAAVVSAMILVSVGIAASAVSATASAATPLGNLIDFGDGSFQRSAGANDAIYIDGLIPYNDNCLHGGIQDFLYPATDVYIVAAGSASSGAQLTDVNGTPNTIVATSTGVFVGELIAVTTPSGSLGVGDYDVVYDNCQDGTVDPGDAVWPDAISVTVPAR